MGSALTREAGCVIKVSFCSLGTLFQKGLPTHLSEEKNKKMQGPSLSLGTTKKKIAEMQGGGVVPNQSNSLFTSEIMHSPIRWNPHNGHVKSFPSLESGRTLRPHSSSLCPAPRQHSFQHSSACLARKGQHCFQGEMSFMF